MVRLLLAALALLAGSHAREFYNPVIYGGDFPDPGAILVDGIYYIISTTNSSSPDKFPIYTSRNLDNWLLQDYAFSGLSHPAWANKSLEFRAPEFHRGIGVGKEFRLYFTARDIKSGNLSIGVATTPTPLGPFKPQDTPLWADPAGDVSDPTLINDNGTLYLLWKANSSIIGQPLTPDGLSLTSTLPKEIFHNDLPWEGKSVSAPWYVRRNQYHYLFYSANDYCSGRYSVGVARSLKPLGPYEKHGDPIIKSNKKFEGPGHTSLVKDLDGVSDVIVFHTFDYTQVCGPWGRKPCLASLAWGSDDWPYIFDF